MRLFADIDIALRNIQSSVFPPHRHHYFELLYILEGSGFHTINDNHYPYEAGNLFLLTPEDTHGFNVVANTRVCIIDFTKGLFAKRHHQETDRAEISEFFVHMEYVFHNHQSLKGYVEGSHDEILLIKALIMQLVAEKESQRAYGGIIAQNIVFLLLNLIARIIQENKATEKKNAGAKNTVHEITSYIQQSIYHKELTRIENLAKHFHKTPDHLNRYFKQHTGITLKAYASRYKLSLVETRLRFSDLNISEIADELGYTDESHLNKAFKLVFGKTAKAYRKAIKRD
ncbi:MAG TPA: AraC family transcriptional regulator [Mucilaginibacter sp.]|jgi:AraC-like DNA-binding protein|nr:AraC family transcriptional regulator [Mucilaginibacter sp.]